MSFNALYRAYLISTEKKGKQNKESSNVSMPFIGLISFLQREKISILNQLGCFNALYRAYLISTSGNYRIKANEMMFQCPLSGLSHFYKIIIV